MDSLCQVYKRESNWSRVVISDTDMSPQRGQATPDGQRSFSRYSRQVSSVPKRSINDIRLILAVLDMVDSTKRREKDRLPKDVSKLTGDEIMQKVFSKRVVKELKRVAQESEPKEPKTE